ncbi:MAG: hypothetical protein ABR899_00585 [Candidatus Krumholzibacteriaceae bacterium]
MRKRVAFKLRIPTSKIRYYAKLYSYSGSDIATDLPHLKQQIKKAKRLTKEQFLTVCRWKATRSASNAENNTPAFVKRITEFSFSTSDERARVESLTLLDGVGWPTASTILHLFHGDKYPILDFRALWSVGVKPPPKYSFDFWWQYTLFCRKLARKAGVKMRTLDKALWQYSKEKQPKRRTVREKHSHRR